MNKVSGFIKFSVLNIFLLIFTSTLSFAQNPLRCSPCNAGDLIDISFFLANDQGIPFGSGCDLTCNIGEEVQGVFLWVQYTNNSNSQRYSIGVEAMVEVNGVGTLYTECLGGLLGSETKSVNITELTWTCGEGVEVLSPYFSWSTQSASTCIYDCTSGNCCMGIKCDDGQPNFLVVEPLPQVACPADTTANACDFANEQAALDAYNSWLSQFQVVSDGDGGTVTQNFPQVSFADFCNGADVIAWIKVEDQCGEDSCGATFTINPAPDVTVNCDMDDEYLGSCMTQVAVQNAYDTWRSAFNSSGGCTLTDNLATLSTTAPDACVGDTITFTYEVTDTKCGGSPVTCTSTFGVAAAPEIIINCYKDTTVENCLTQADVDGIYALWVAGFTTSGGCNAVESFSPAVPASAPDVTLGGSYTVVYTVTGDCDMKSCTTSFTVPTPMTLVVTCPMDTTVLACTSQTTIDQAYANWIAQFSDQGGCPDYTRSTINSVAPSRCTGEVREIIYTVTDSYMVTESCTATFQVIAPDPFLVFGPADLTLAVCTDQASIDMQFATWIDSFDYSGGCGSFIPSGHTGHAAPNRCNPSPVIVNYMVSDGCGNMGSHSATFSVAAPEPLMIVCAPDVYLPACASPTDINNAFSTWLTGFSASGGCNPQITTLPSNPATQCMGDTLEFIYTITDLDCQTEMVCTSYFGVANPTPLVYNANTDTTISACSDQATVDAAYANWLAGFSFSGGCNASDNAASFPTSAPSVLTGGMETINYVVTSDCESPTIPSATFLVPAPGALIVTCPMDTTVLACTPQATIDQAYANWIAQFSDQGGCPDYTRSTINTVAPSRCTGEVREIIYTVTDSYMVTESCTATFQVIAPDPFLVFGPADLTLAVCTDQASIDMQFATWIDSFDYSGGCGSFIPSGHTGHTAPNRCSPSPVIVNYMVSDGCGNMSSHSATFSVAAPDPLMIVCAPDVYLPACASPTAINNAFSTWLTGFSASGGCNPQVTPLPSNPATQCMGDTLEFIYTIMDLDCQTELVCTSYFGVANPTPLTYNTNTDTTISSCTDQGTVDAAYAAWLAGFNFSGGCNASDNAASFPATAPSVTTGGMETINYVVTSDCASPIIPSASFIVPAPGTFEVSCPLDQFEPACSDQTFIDGEFNTWVGQFMPLGGCDPVEPGDLPTTPPDVCIGDTIVYTYVVMDAFGFSRECTRSFGVAAPPVLVVTGPSDLPLLVCTDQSEINSQFLTWIGLFDYSGGCPTYVTTDLSIYTAPNKCIPVDVVINYSVTDNCGTTEMHTATFSVGIPPVVNVDGPGNETYSVCDFGSQSEVDMAFNTWLTQFVLVEDGCSATPQFNPSFYTIPDACLGGTVSLTYSADDGCTDDMVTATFTINPINPVAVNCPSAANRNSCDFTDQAALNDDYNTWKNSVSITQAGCNATGSFLLDQGAPDICTGGTAQIIYQAMDGCTMATCTSTYTVNPGPTVMIDCPGSKVVGNCDFKDQVALDSAYNEWRDLFIMTNSGCGAVGEFIIDEGAPDLGLASTSTILFGASDGCSGDTCEATFQLTLAPQVEVSCSTVPMEVIGCNFVDQDALDADFEAWKIASFVVIETGCGAVTYFLNNPPAPDRCSGGSVEVTFVADDGQTQTSCTQTYTVIGAPQVAIGCPGNIELEACQFSTQHEIDSLFERWLGFFVVTEMGCGGGSIQDLSGYTAPLLCTGGEVSITYSHTDGCTTAACSKYFQVERIPPVVTNCSEDYIETECVDPTESFKEWLEGFSVSGGCEPLTIAYTVDYGSGNVVIYNSIEDIPSIAGCTTLSVAASASGGFGCSSADCIGTYTYEPESKIQVSCPEPIFIEPCSDYEFELLDWAEGFVYEGGCEPTTITYTVTIEGNSYSFDDLEDAFELIPSCGGTMTIGYKVEDFYDCSMDACSSTFTILQETPVFLLCAPRVQVAQCEDFLPMFEHWIDDFSWGGGCDLEVRCCISYDDGPIIIVNSFDQVPAPSKCGEKLDITIKITSQCQGEFTCSSSFEIKAGDPIELYCPENAVVPSCLSNIELAALYDNWVNAFSYVGGCNTEARFVGEVPPVPYYCGGMVEVVYMVTDVDGCQEDQICTATFSVEEVGELLISCPEDIVIDNCMDQSEIDELYAAWLGSFGYNGSCAPNGTIVGGAPSAPSACGGHVEVTYHIPNKRSCFPIQTCTRTFTVTSGELPSIEGDTADVVLGCNQDYPDGSDVSALDHCGNMLTLTISDVLVLDENSSTETLVRTWSSEGSCATGILATQTLIRKVDNTPPELGLDIPLTISSTCSNIPQPETFDPSDESEIAEFGMYEDTVFFEANACPAVFTILRTYFAINSCGLESSLTQEIEVKSEAGPQFINAPEDICEVPISMDEFMNMDFGSLQISDPCTNLIGESKPGKKSFDCESFVYTITWEASDACGNTNIHTQLICIEVGAQTCEITSLSESFCGGISSFNLITTNLTAPFDIKWEVVSGGWMIEAGQDSAVVLVRSFAQDAILMASITDANGCQTSCTKVLACKLNGACTYSQEFYGSSETAQCNQLSATALLNELITADPITIGLPGRSFTFSDGDELCINDLLGPVDGNPAPLKEGNGDCANINFELDDQGQVANELVSQAIALSLNMRLDSQLHYLSLDAQCIRTLNSEDCKVGHDAIGVDGTLDTFCFSPIVLDRVGAGFKVASLKLLVDSALAGFDINLKLTELVRAVKVVNEAFENCRVIKDFGDFADISSTNIVETSDKKVLVDKQLSSEYRLSLSPNPTTNRLNVFVKSDHSGRAHLLIRDQNGIIRDLIPIQLFKGENEYRINVSKLPEGIYVLQLMDGLTNIIQKFVKI